jgi:DNA-binding PadR family transcriptional regulator
MPITIKSYYKTTPIDDETLLKAIASAKDQENKIYQLFKKFGCMTTWDVYDVYNELVSPILHSSVGRSINTLIKQNVIYSLGTITGEAGRPVNLYELSDISVDVIERKLNEQIPKSIKIDIYTHDNGDFNVEKMIEEMDIKLSNLSQKFNLNY